MAPDKIYTCYNIEEGEKRQLWSTVLLSDVEQVGEYIRKDALLEWAKNLKDRWEEPPMSKHSPGCVYMLEQVIQKIESL